MQWCCLFIDRSPVKFVKLFAVWQICWVLSVAGSYDDDAGDDAGDGGGDGGGGHGDGWQLFWIILASAGPEFLIIVCGNFWKSFRWGRNRTSWTDGTWWSAAEGWKLLWIWRFCDWWFSVLSSCQFVAVVFNRILHTISCLHVCVFQAVVCHYIHLFLVFSVHCGGVVSLELRWCCSWGLMIPHMSWPVSTAGYYWNFDELEIEAVSVENWHQKSMKA